MAYDTKSCRMSENGGILIMRILFMGTPDFAVPTLQALIDSEHEIVGVVTQPDKPKGRGGKMQCSPVKELAVKAGFLFISRQQ